MRCSEAISYFIDFEVKHLSVQNMLSIYGEIMKFGHAWPSATVDVNINKGEIKISYKDFSNQRNACYDAATMFSNNMRRFTWWEEK